MSSPSSVMTRTASPLTVISTVPDRTPTTPMARTSTHHTPTSPRTPSTSTLHIPTSLRARSTSTRPTATLSNGTTGSSGAAASSPSPAPSASQWLPPQDEPAALAGPVKIGVVLRAEAPLGQDVRRLQGRLVSRRGLRRAGTGQLGDRGVGSARGRHDRLHRSRPGTSRRDGDSRSRRRSPSTR
jgi:hypothetical protein